MVLKHLVLSAREWYKSVVGTSHASLSSSPLWWEFESPKGQFQHMWESNLTSVPNLLKRQGCVLSCLCDWHTLKNMCGSLEYAQPPYFYLLYISVWLHEVSKCVALKVDTGRHSPTWDGRLVCSPGSWSGKSWLLLNIRNDKKKRKLPELEWTSDCKAPLIRHHYFLGCYISLHSFIHFNTLNFLNLREI